MRKLMVWTMAIALTTLPLFARDKDDQEREDQRLQNCGKTLNELLNAADTGLPQFILDHAFCVITVPGVKKANGFIFTAGFGGEFGRGAMTCRTGEHFDGPWGAPTMVALEGVNWGLAIGGASSDILILVMNDVGANSVLTSKVKMGGDVTATAGPVGRDAAAETDAMLHSELLTYSRSKGLFGGATLTGSTLRADGPANERIYGKKVDAKDVVLHSADPAPAAAKDLLDALNKRSPKRKADSPAPQGNKA